jgi:predicted permease
MIHPILRRLWRARAFTLTSVALIAAAVLANAASFSALYALLWKPLPYAHGDDLVELRMDLQDVGIQVGLSEALHRELLADASTFSGGVGSIAFSRTPHDERGRAWSVQRITVDFGRVLGVAPALGRGFAEDDADAGSSPILVSDAAWRAKLAGDTKVVGSRLRLTEREYTVVGVMPPGFSYPDADVDAWIPYVATAAEREQDAAGGFGQFTVAGRLAAGASAAQAQASLAALLANTELLARMRHSGARFSASVRTWRERFSAGHARALTILQLASLLLMAVVAANLSNLTISRFAARRREFALYDAVGAGSRQRRRLVAAELLPLALAGLALGVALTPFSNVLLKERGLIPAALSVAVGDDWAMLAVAVATAGVIAAIMVVGALSALRHDQPLSEGLRERSTATAGGARRGWLTITQVALCTALVGGAGLLLRSATLLVNEDRGFDATGVLLTSVDLSEMAMQGADETQVAATLERLRSSVAALPGVRSLAYADSTPFGTANSIARVRVGDSEQEVRTYAVSPGYFKAMGIRLSMGRDFVREDANDSNPIVVDAAVRKLWLGDEDPLSSSLRLLTDDERGFVDAPIIAVAPSVKHNALDESAGLPAIYQLSSTAPYAFTFVSRTDGDPAALVDPVRKLLEQHAPLAVIAMNMPMQEAVALTLVSRLALLELVSVFALLAVAMAAVGLYATLSLEVGGRIGEFGLRMALGASGADIRRMVMAQAGAKVSVGIGLGVVVGVVAAHLGAQQLYNIPAYDLAAWAGTCALIAVVALVASWIPARRATAVAPHVALQVD